MVSGLTTCEDVRRGKSETLGISRSLIANICAMMSAHPTSFFTTHSSNSCNCTQFLINLNTKLTKCVWSPHFGAREPSSIFCSSRTSYVRPAFLQRSILTSDIVRDLHVTMSSAERYMARGVSASKEDVHNAIANVCSTHSPALLQKKSSFSSNPPLCALQRASRDNENVIMRKGKQAGTAYMQWQG